MRFSLTSLPQNYRALVVGGNGAIGAAVLERLGNDARCGARFAASRTIVNRPGVEPLKLDLAEPQTIAAAVEAASADGPLHLVFVATGALHSQGSIEPEKSWRQISADGLMESYKVNTVLPSLVAQAALPKLARGRKDAPEKAEFAALSARVGSVSDNRLGGWHAYRASKAALNQVIKTCSIELKRKAPHAVCVGLHPGTVDSALSKPFQRNVPDGKLFTPQYSAERLLSVIDGLDAAQSGKVFDWAGAEIAP